MPSRSPTAPGCSSTAPPAPSRPTPTQEAERRVAADREPRAALASWSGPGHTADGAPVKILANVADGESARKAASQPIEGVGLFRTELCFLNRKDEPSVEEQADIYAEVLDPSTRTGTSWCAPSTPAPTSRVAFATLEGEENPALGVRGLRLSFDNPALLDRQLDAIAEAAKRPAPRPG